MKKLLIILFVLLFTSTAVSFADFYDTHKKPEKEEGGVCPETKIKGKVTDCLSCHVLKEVAGAPVFGLKEIIPFAEFTTPNGSKFKTIGGEVVAWYDFVDVDDDKLRYALEYYYRHDVKTMILNVDSFGGSAFDAYAIISIIEEYEGKMSIVTQLQSYAMSAGFLVFVGGHYRVVSPMAVLMWHEISYFAFFKKVSPSSSEQEAKIMRMLQDMANEYLASRSKVSKEFIDAEIDFKDWFISGQMALEMGFADELIK